MTLDLEIKNDSISELEADLKKIKKEIKSYKSQEEMVALQMQLIEKIQAENDSESSK